MGYAAGNPRNGFRMSEPRTTPAAGDTRRQTPEDIERQTPGAPVPGAESAPPALLGRYEVRALLGEGAFGRVYSAYDPQLARQVAIKLAKTEGMTDEYRAWFLREARATATIHHPNVCPVYDFGTERDLPYIVMRFVDGGTLADLMKRQKALAARNAVAVARKLALGLDAAHVRGVVHRDMKPANVLFEAATTEVLIADFGLARLDGRSGLVSTGGIKGTPAYMSPEQARAKAELVGPLSDVYSLGVVLYELATGRLPFEGETVWEVMRDHCETPPRAPSAVCPTLDLRFDALCLKALAKNSADRYGSAKDFAKALAEYLRGPKPPEPGPTVKPTPDTVYVDWREGAKPPDPVPVATAPPSGGEADYQQGQMHFFGRGVARSYTKARACYESAAALGHAAAQFQLGVLSAHGQGGPVDWLQARDWYAKAAAQGHAEAQAYLAELYENGRGVAADPLRALELYRSAAAQGNVYAKKAIKRLGGSK